MKNTAQENLMLRYLLGALSEAEQVALEQEYFADSEKFEQIWALENELVDDYVRGSLPNKERALFERNYLASPKHQERVAVARSLLQTADASLVETEAVVPVTKKSSAPWWANWMALFRPPQLVWGGALALLLLAGWWFFRPTSQEQIAVGNPSPSVAKTETPTPATPSPWPTAQPSATSGPEEPSPKPTPRSLPSAQPAAPSVLAFVLVGAGVRDESKMQPLAIPIGTKQVRLQMKLSDEAYQDYQIQLRSVGGAEIFSQSSLKPTANKKFVVATLPAAQLSQGDYFVTLSGRNQAGESEEVNKYFLRVVRK